MKISRCAKSIVYMILTSTVLVLSTYFQIKMHNVNSLENAYFQSNAYLFISAAVFIGTAVYSFRSYTKYHREHLTDSLFLLLVGIALMIASVFTIISYGGLGDTFEASGYTAANVNIALMTALPIPFLIRGFALALTKHEDNHSIFRPALVFCILVAVAYILSIAFGGMMRMIYYDNTSFPSSPSSSEIVIEKSI